MWPSRSPPILMWCTWARPWVMPSRFSLRVSTQRTGLPVCLAAQAMRICSRSTPIFAPNPPPTSGATTRIASGGSPMAVKISRDSWAFWVDVQTVSFPSLNTAAVARPSIGRAATRWLTTSPSTMTSHPSKIESSPMGRPPLHAHVGARVGEQQGLIRQRGLDRRHGGQQLVVDADQLRGVLAPYVLSVSTSATGSPTNRTRSNANSGSCQTPPIGAGPSGGGASSGTGSAGGGGGRSVMSAAVSTATTPGASSAAEVSMPVIRACATVDRTNVARTAPARSGSRKSST